MFDNEVIKLLKIINIIYPELKEEVDNLIFTFNIQDDHFIESIEDLFFNFNIKLFQNNEKILYNKYFSDYYLFREYYIKYLIDKIIIKYNKIISPLTYICKTLDNKYTIRIGDTKNLLSLRNEIPIKYDKNYYLVPLDIFIKTYDIANIDLYKHKIPYSYSSGLILTTRSYNSKILRLHDFTITNGFIDLSFRDIEFREMFEVYKYQNE